ncbi:MAG: response regulator [Planctomycetota bacterium]
MALVDDHEIVRDGLRTLLSTVESIEVVGQAGDGDAAVRMVLEAKPDVVLLDLRMPEVSGIDVIRELRRREAGGRVIILTTFDDPDALAEAIRAGADGYLLKDTSLAALVDAIERVHRGERVLRTSPHVPAADAPAPRRDDSWADQDPGLTPREREVLQMLASGLTNRQIAESLALAEGTVKNHVSVVLDKLRARTRTEAVLRAMRSGWL